MVFKTLKLPLKLFQTNPKAISEVVERPSKVEMSFGLELQTTSIKLSQSIGHCKVI